MIRIITDSAADYEPNELIKKNITCVSMKIAFGSTEYQENISLSKDQFYDMLIDGDEFPKTSQPSPFDFENILQDFKNAGDECIIITISSALSGTYQNATLTAKMLEYDSCYVIDSLNATGGQRMLADIAVKLRDEGKAACEIVNIIETLKHKITLKACIDTLEYLYKGGRLSKTAYTVGSFVNLKPVIEINNEGKVEVCGKTLSIKKGLKTICNSIENNKPDSDYPIYIVYSHNKKYADVLVHNLRNLGFEIKDENIFNIGATIGAHVGPNACGYIYVSK
ncbi:MAG: DegV family protein [Clostridia bacterium]|nr:DegV family protein [Clostridia bacterium]